MVIHESMMFQQHIVELVFNGDMHIHIVIIREGYLSEEEFIQSIERTKQITNRKHGFGLLKGSLEN